MKILNNIVLVETILAMILLPPIFAQNLLNNPESVVFDQENNRYLVSNWGNGDLIEIDSFQEQRPFSTILTRVAGLHIVGDVVYAASNYGSYPGIVGFDLASSEMVVHIRIDGLELVNDITSDTSGYLYATDYYADRIYKIRLEDQAVSIFVDSGLSMPNGILFNDDNNRLLVISEAEFPYPIKAVSLLDSSVTVVVNTNLTNVDGLTEDNEENVYFSSWTTGCVYRYDSTFSNPREMVSSGHAGPADIFFNKRDNILAVPNFNANSLDLIPISPTAISEIQLPRKTFTLTNYPNPFNGSTIITYSDLEAGEIEIYDITGHKIRTLNTTVKEGKTVWDARDALGNKVSSGVYFARAKRTVYNTAIKLLYLK